MNKVGGAVFDKREIVINPKPIIVELESMKYSPDQPRDPAGTATGGQWTDSGAAGNRREFTTYTEANRWANDQDGLSPDVEGEQLESLQNYARSSGYYRPLNAYLRKGEFEISDDPDAPINFFESRAEVQEMISEMDEAFVDTGATESFAVYRGLAAEVFPADATGLEFTDGGYMSASLSKEVGEKFGRWAREDGFTPALMEITVPAGNPAIFMNATISPHGESEILLPRGMTLRIVSDKTISGIRYLTAEVTQSGQE